MKRYKSPPKEEACSSSTCDNESAVKLIDSDDEDCVATVEDSDNENNTIIMSVEEYEVIRLIDKEELTQEECALQMNVSRPTVQLIYTQARKKLAEFLTKGTNLKIEGGTYEICPNASNGCMCKNCKCK